MPGVLTTVSREMVTIPRVKLGGIALATHAVDWRLRFAGSVAGRVGSQLGDTALFRGDSLRNPGGEPKANEIVESKVVCPHGPIITGNSERQASTFDLVNASYCKRDRLRE